MATLSRGPKKNQVAKTNSEWTLGEDDAWDSASDEESAYKNRSASASRLGFNFGGSSGKLSPSKPIPVTSSQSTSTSPSGTTTSKLKRNVNGLGLGENTSSSSSIGFSYTHVNFPSPSSSYPKQAIATPSGGYYGSDSPRTSTTADMSEPTSSTSAKGLPKKSAGGGWTIISPPVPSRGMNVFEADVDYDPEADAEHHDLDTEATEALNEGGGSNRRIRDGREAIKYDIDDIVNDPLHSVHSLSLTEYEERVASGIGHPELQHQHAMRAQKRQKFVDCLTADNVDMNVLRKLAWSGIPDELRPISWMLLLGYLPLSAATRKTVLHRKREEFANLVNLTFSRGIEGLDQKIWHQIEKDVPRTRPGVRLWMEGATQRSLERILYIWAIRHPTSGYVQGINDLVTPFFQTFLGGYIDSDPSLFDPALLPESALNALEADSFWCFSRLLDGIQDNYIAGQPGIHRSLKYLSGLVARVDAPLSKHLQSQNVEFMQFAFRWMNCLLMRELSVKNIIRMWDTYLSEGSNAFSQFHIYVCCAFLTTWSEKLREMDFQGIILFLQSLPTQSWSDHEIEVILAEAYVLNSVWHNAQSHLLKDD